MNLCAIYTHGHLLLQCIMVTSRLSLNNTALYAEEACVSVHPCPKTGGALGRSNNPPPFSSLSKVQIYIFDLNKGKNCKKVHSFCKLPLH